MSTPMKSKSKNVETDPGTCHSAWAPADLETAYQIHTLAELVRGHLAMSNPWAASPSAGICWPPSAACGLPMYPSASPTGAIPMVWP